MSFFLTYHALRGIIIIEIKERVIKMKLKLSECSINKFLNYSIERKADTRSKNRYNLSYITPERLVKVFEYMSRKNLSCKGTNYYVSDEDGFRGQFTQPEKESKELMEEVLYHEVWCECEWIYRILDKEKEFYETLKSYIGSKAISEFASI